MPTALGGHVFATTRDMATKTWLCHPPVLDDSTGKLALAHVTLAGSCHLFGDAAAEGADR